MSTKMAKEVCLSWSSHGKILSRGLWKFFQENYRTDLDVSVSGHYLKVHHLILAVFSPLIKECEVDKFIKGDFLPIDKEDLQYLIEFMYCGQINVPEIRLPNILKSAETLGFRALANVVQKYISSHKIKIPAKLKNDQQSVKPSERQPQPADDVTPSSATEQAKQVPATEVPEKLKEISKAVRERRVRGGRRWTRSTDCTSLTKVDHSTFDPVSLQYRCKHCEQGFDAFIDYAHHMREFHDKKLRHKCPHCMHRSRWKTSLAEHMVAKHQVDLRGNKLERNVRCDKCSFTCCAKFQLKSHVNACHAIKKYKCEVCDYAAVTKSFLKKHVDFTHSNERPFMCDTCGSTFKTFHQFRNHAMIHAGKKRMCELCGANIAVNAFGSHMKTHSENKPFPCNLCSFGARKRYNLKVHLKNVHNVSAEDAETSGGDHHGDPQVEAQGSLFDPQALTEALMTIGDDYGTNYS